MARALGSHAEVSSAAHLPAAANNGTALTLFRVTGFEPSVEARCALLPDLLQDYCTLRRLEPSDADALWKMTATGRALRERKSVGKGKSVSERVDLGGRRFLNKKKEKIQQN